MTAHDRWLGWLVVVVASACGARTELNSLLAAPDEAGPDGDDSCVSSDSHLALPSNAPWTDTGVDVLAGSRLIISVSGMVRYGPNASQTTDANGGNYDGTKFFADSVLPNAVTVSVIGKVGGTTMVGSGTPLPEGIEGDGAGFVGTSYDQVVSESGRLFLGFNDQTGYFGDNSGSFDVSIVATPCE